MAGGDPAIPFTSDIGLPKLRVPARRRSGTNLSNSTNAFGARSAVVPTAVHGHQPLCIQTTISKSLKPTHIAPWLHRARPSCIARHRPVVFNESRHRPRYRRREKT